jgi:hypothetical protein
MPALENQFPTLLDVTNALDPDGSVAAVAEILNMTNEILDDMVWIEGNLPTGHVSTARGGIPRATWRKLYGGVKGDKSSRVRVTDTCGMLERYAKIDKALADLNGNGAAYRASEDRAYIEGISQQMAETVFRGDTSIHPERFMGLNPRFNSLSAENRDNIVDGGGVGTDNASIWLIGWSNDTVHGIYPKGSKAGLQVRDLGEDTAEADDGSGEFQIYRTHYKWDCGLTVRDWRYIVRIPNIDRSLLHPKATTGANLPDLMFEATERVPSLQGVKLCFYMDRTVRTRLRQQVAAGVSQSTLTYDMVGGKRIMAFDEIPIKRTDALMIDEARVVA